MAKFRELCYELLPHSPYSLDLAPNYLFPNLKKWLSGNKFDPNDELISQRYAYFEDLTIFFFWKGEKNWRNGQGV